MIALAVSSLHQKPQLAGILYNMADGYANKSINQAVNFQCASVVFTVDLETTDYKSLNSVKE